MDEALKCVVCSYFAKEAVESTCDCHLLYCSNCAIYTNHCVICKGSLKWDVNFKEKSKITEGSDEISLLKNESDTHGFRPNILARRMIN